MPDRHPSPEAEEVPGPEARLRALLGSLGGAVVAFSGGADSAFLAWTATDVLGPDRVVCATAVSPSLASSELDDVRALAAEWGLRSVEVATGELDDPAYAANDGDRCAHCKTALMAALSPLARDVGGVGDGGGGTAPVLLGVNVDDLGDRRPGQQAAAALGARFPLVEAGFTKGAVRAASRRHGLRTWNKPAAACLASRVPYGTPVTLGTLQSVAAAEAAVHALGFHELRIRHYGEAARIEVPLDGLADVVRRRQEVAAAVHAAGYRYVTLDLDGLRSGNLNDALAEASEGAAAANREATR